MALPETRFFGLTLLVRARTEGCGQVAFCPSRDHDRPRLREQPDRTGPGLPQIEDSPWWMPQMPQMTGWWWSFLNPIWVICDICG